MFVIFVCKLTFIGIAKALCWYYVVCLFLFIFHVQPLGLEHGELHRYNARHSKLSLCAVTNIAQRHANPELQAATTDQLYPRHKQLLIRQSVRCKVSLMTALLD